MDRNNLVGVGLVNQYRKRRIWRPIILEERHVIAATANQHRCRERHTKMSKE
jgi:hypothetical protein